MAENSVNEWTFSGEVFYLKELSGEFAASMKLRGTSQRVDAHSVQIAEVSCLLPDGTFDSFLRDGGKVYCKAKASGHIESWIKNDSAKLMLIADSVILF